MVVASASHHQVGGGYGVRRRKMRHAPLWRAKKRPASKQARWSAFIDGQPEDCRPGNLYHLSTSDKCQSGYDCVSGHIRGTPPTQLVDNEVAEREGFEPSEGLLLHRFSKPAL